ncbi:MAG: hypothetical protein EHM42_02070 [Planctomycetaceae bacterium]|nr:MAG: hypothetical protein EHM42_02070 [Planctomycetaceae bacterium]
MPQPLARKHLPSLVCAVVYLFVSVAILSLHLLGLSPGGPLAYAFTWDMFPGFQSQSTRRVAIGQTRSGRWIVLHPSGRQQFREGLWGDMSRADLERAALYFRAIAEQVRLQTLGERVDDPLVRVILGEQYWPTKFNLSDRNYIRWMGEAKPPADIGHAGLAGDLLDPPAGVPHASWRVLDDYLVEEHPAEASLPTARHKTLPSPRAHPQGPPP